ncbi:MAG: aldo/keto reductase [Clostridiales bacterium]
MKYRRFGKTDINMPVFSCGGMRFNQSWEDKPYSEIEKTNQENIEIVIDKALSLGINHIETARSYGTSEMQLGKALKNFKREKIILQTKIAPSENVADFTKKFEMSLNNLKVDYVDLLSIHGINDQLTYDWSIRKNGILSEVRKLQNQGLCKFVGFSTHGPNDIILKTIQSGEFDYVNLHWYYIFQKNWPVIDAANTRDMGVFIISPNDKGGKLYSPSQKLVELCKPLSPMAFNDLFCLSKSQIHTLSLGISNPSDFDEHVNTLQYYDDIEKVIKPIVEKLDNELNKIQNELGFDYWNEELIPTWEKTPGGINIKNIIWLWHLYKAFDMLEYAKGRYNLLGNGGHWFPGQKVKLSKLKIIESIINNSKVYDTICNILTETHQILNTQDEKRLSESK